MRLAIIFVLHIHIHYKLFSTNFLMELSEHVVIFSNHCRGLQDTHLITENFNTYVNFPKKSQKKIDKLRRNSINRAEKSLKPYDIIDYSQFMTKPKTKTKTKRRKRGTKRKGAKRSNILIYSDN